ncbi:metal-dependent hydrolase [Acinetobacter sichuanensis]|uniref:Metal-dependent hydrolase n=1 Tax=Acinetobacter sichuanensis TaxID=2136183 RepID=A0A371YLF9_9GAMM|nr:MULTISPECIES: metal-dependent hydrolase [Acinetobacter]MDM1762971.1 metal-dependent hydrolase [Acinetobacter sp. 226-1]MDM1766450.1 metal-dependent hydrolase [Acinetobacter sp. 226-4]MDQ9019977.1 metal-dependent hydrolase [Acinetobacter sichuanensis]RFC82291.1 metal-dependent hydrolase [Acinetobacter sichuanensis]
MLKNLSKNAKQYQRHLQSTISIRKTRFDAQYTERHYTHATLISHFLTALSITFPQGERFFVETVRNVRDQIENPRLQADISGFIGQEAHHAQAHEQFNQAVQSPHYNLMHYNAAFEKEMKRLRTLTQRRQLAATVALEHFTALMAGYMLKYPEFMFKGLSPNMKQLWLWHAIEEIEHKHVAFEVYQTIFNHLPQRRRSMRTITIGFISSTTFMTADLLWQDRKNSLYSPQQLFKNIKALYGLGLMMLRLSPEYFAFYRADFHPEQLDQQELLEQGRQLLNPS